MSSTYQDMASQYAVAIDPHPQTQRQGKTEVGVQIVERWILAALLHQTFFTLLELNQAIATLLAKFNEHPFQKLPNCRAEQFKRLDYPALNLNE